MPVHVIRYEDLVLEPRPALTELIKFILNVRSLEGTRVQSYIDLACRSQAPEIYRPRKGRVNANMSKFQAVHLDYMSNWAADLIGRFGYQDLFSMREGHEDVNGII